MNRAGIENNKGRDKNGTLQLNNDLLAFFNEQKLINSIEEANLYD